MLVAMRLAAIAIAILLAATRIAAAAPPGDAEAGDPEASAAFQRGRELARAGRYAEACAEFDRSYQLEAALGTAVNLADCLERQGELHRAWTLFDLVARTSQSNQSRARLARERADALVARLATLVIHLRDPTTPGLAVRIGDRSVPPAAEIRELVDPRDVEVVIVATAPGRSPFRAARRPTAGATLTVDIPALAPPPVATPVEVRRRRGYVYLAAGLGAVGAIGIGTSIGLGLQARGTYHDALDRECLPAQTVEDDGYRACQARIDRAGTQADRATVIGIAGGALAAAAIAIFFVAPSETYQVAPIATAHQLGIGVIGRF
jgi:tetratricopeptide (TPR) repeat protein